MQQYIELSLQVAIIVMLFLILFRNNSGVTCYCGTKPSANPAGYTEGGMRMPGETIYESGEPVYPEVGVYPSTATTYQTLDNCYQNGGVYDFDRNICRYDYQNMGVVRDQGYSNPKGKIIQEYAYQANKRPINWRLPY